MPRNLNVIHVTLYDSIVHARVVKVYNLVAKAEDVYEAL